MEEIIGLLVVLAIGIFKAVSKKLENAGTQQAPKTFQDVLEELTMEEQRHEAPAPWPVQPEPVQPEPVQPKPVQKSQPSTIEVVTRQTAPKKPILEEPEPEGPKEKIDPKKLVLYSEIMNPKFNE